MARDEGGDLEPGEAPEPLRPEVVEKLPGWKKLPQRDVACHGTHRLRQLNPQRHGDERRGGQERHDERQRLRTPLGPRAARGHVDEHEQAHRQQREDVRVPRDQCQERDAPPAGNGGLPPLRIEGDQKQRARCNAEREVEHPHGHEPVVDHGPEKEGRHHHPPPPAKRQYEERARQGAQAEDQQDEHPRRGNRPRETPDEEEPREERRIGLEETVERKLGVATRVLDDARRGEMIGQVLQRRDGDERKRPRRDHEKPGT